MADWRDIRERAGISRAKAAALADTTEHTARLFEHGIAVKREKAEALARVYSGFERARDVRHDGNSA